MSGFTRNLTQQVASYKLFVVFDEAHHSPAPSYYRFISQLRKHNPGMYLLGLTATPTYTDQKKRGGLNELFKEILYQISPQELMPAKVLAQPFFFVVALISFTAVMQ